jgi:hypothetical protein
MIAHPEPPGNRPGNPAFFRRSRITTVHSLAHFLVHSFLVLRARGRNRNNRCSPPRRRPGCETRRAPRLRCAHTRTPTLTTHRTHSSQTDARETSTISDQRVRARRVRPTFQRGAYVWRDDYRPLWLRWPSALSLLATHTHLTLYPSRRTPHVTAWRNPQKSSITLVGQVRGTHRQV